MRQQQYWWQRCRTAHQAMYCHLLHIDKLFPAAGNSSCSPWQPLARWWRRACRQHSATLPCWLHRRGRNFVCCCCVVADVVLCPVHRTYTPAYVTCKFPQDAYAGVANKHHWALRGALMTHSWLHVSGTCEKPAPSRSSKCFQQCIVPENTI